MGCHQPGVLRWRGWCYWSGGGEWGLAAWTSISPDGMITNNRCSLYIGNSWWVYHGLSSWIPDLKSIIDIHESHWYLFNTYPNTYLLGLWLESLIYTDFFILGSLDQEMKLIRRPEIWIDLAPFLEDCGASFFLWVCKYLPQKYRSSDTMCWDVAFLKIRTQLLNKSSDRCICYGNFGDLFPKSRSKNLSFLLKTHFNQSVDIIRIFFAILSWSQ